MKVQNSSCVYSISLLVPILCQIKPDHEVPSYFFKIDFNIILLSHKDTRQYIFRQSVKLLWLNNIKFRWLQTDAVLDT